MAVANKDPVAAAHAALSFVGCFYGPAMIASCVWDVGEGVYTLSTSEDRGARLEAWEQIGMGGFGLAVAGQHGAFSRGGRGGGKLGGAKKGPVIIGEVSVQSVKPSRLEYTPGDFGPGRNGMPAEWGGGTKPTGIIGEVNVGSGASKPEYTSGRWGGPAQDGIPAVFESSVKPTGIVGEASGEWGAVSQSGSGGKRGTSILEEQTSQRKAALETARSMAEGNPTAEHMVAPEGGSAQPTESGRADVAAMIEKETGLTKADLKENNKTNINKALDGIAREYRYGTRDAAKKRLEDLGLSGEHSEKVLNALDNLSNQRKQAIAAPEAVPEAPQVASKPLTEAEMQQARRQAVTDGFFDQVSTNLGRHISASTREALLKAAEGGTLEDRQTFHKLAEGRLGLTQEQAARLYEATREKMVQAEYAATGTEEHHVFTDKNNEHVASNLNYNEPFTPLFLKLVAKLTPAARSRDWTVDGQLSLNVDKNIVPVQGHNGPHAVYDALVYETMTDALRGLAPQTAGYDQAFNSMHTKIKELSAEPGNEFNRLLTLPPGAPEKQASYTRAEFDKLRAQLVIP